MTGPQRSAARCDLADDYPPGSSLYADLREKWKHEDELIHQRVSWLLSSQAFLLTAFGAIAKLRLDVEGDTELLLDLLRNQLWLLYTLGESLIVMCAVVVTYTLRHGIVAARDAMAAIKRELEIHQQHGRVWRGVRVDIRDGITEAGALPSQALASTFLGVWVLCLLHEVWRTTSVALHLFRFS